MRVPCPFAAGNACHPLYGPSIVVLMLGHALLLSVGVVVMLQAFLNDHTDLRESPSFGDVCALVGQWANLEDAPAEDEHLLLSSAFSF